MQKKYVERRKLVEKMLQDNPRCPGGQLIWWFERDHRCLLTATEVHEIKTRARGGSILDESNCVALCRNCHRWVTENPTEAVVIGMMRNSWDS